MSGKSTADLELEAEAARARMAETANTIRSKLTAGQMLDEFSGMVSGGDLSQGLGKLKDQVRDNPLPLTLIGAGIALLAFGPRTGGSSAGAALGSLFGGGRSHDRQPDEEEHFAGGVRRRPPTPGSEGRPADPFAAAGNDDGNGSGGEGLAAKASGAAHVAADGVRSAAGSVRSAAHDAGERVSDGASHLMDTADRLGHEMLTGASRRTKQATSAAADAIEQEPLAIGALGLLLGAILGATLPVSQFEEEQLGPHAKKLRKGAEDLADRGIKGASAAVSETYESARDEVDRQGLRPGDGETISSRVGEVAKAAVETADEAVRSTLGARQDQEPRART
jgi:hypothetical protein